MRYFLTLCLLYISFCVSAKRVYINSSSDIQKQFSFCKTTYIISDSINLKGMHLRIPSMSKLVIRENGYINNGLIEGVETEIEADNRNIFASDITIVGSWNNHKVYASWFSSAGLNDSNLQWKNIMQLCKGSLITHLYSEDIVYNVSAIDQSAPILMPSNVYWHNKSTICMNGCSLSKYSIVLIRNVENVTIDGGIFIGDVKSHIGSKGEWGHGIKVGGAKMITLKNLTCSYCWGDGIDLIEGFDDNGNFSVNCSHITINNVKCLYNRRQGLSIEAADNVTITDSEFAFTGNPCKAAPSAGLDIEPWTNNAKKVFNILIKNCKMHNNSGRDFLCLANWLLKDGYDAYSNNILLENCDIGNSVVSCTKGINFVKCNIRENILIKSSCNILMRESNVNNLSTKNIKNFKKQNCTKNAETIRF